MTTGTETKEPEEIETVAEEGDGEENGEPVLAPRADVKRKSNRRVHRHHSIKKGRAKSILKYILYCKTNSSFQCVYFGNREFN